MILSRDGYVQRDVILQLRPTQCTCVTSGKIKRVYAKWLVEYFFLPSIFGTRYGHKAVSTTNWLIKNLAYASTHAHTHARMYVCALAPFSCKWDRLQYNTPTSRCVKTQHWCAHGTAYLFLCARATLTLCQFDAHIVSKMTQRQDLGWFFFSAWCLPVCDLSVRQTP